MKSSGILGIILVVLGCVSLAYHGISYTRQKTILKVGSLEATTDKKETIPIPPVVGGLVLAAGIGLLVLGRKS